MSCTYEEALQIEEDFLQFAQEIKERNASKQACNNSVNTSRSSNKKIREDPMENFCRLLDKIAALNEQNRKLKEKVQILEEKEEFQRMIITSTYLHKQNCYCNTTNGKNENEKNFSDSKNNPQQEEKSNRRRHSSSGSSRNWDKNGGKIQNQNLERDSPVIKVVPSPVGNLRCNSASSVTSSLDNIIFSDPYAELESQQHLSAEVGGSVKRSSSCTQVNELQPRFVQRRHSLTSISGKGSPIEDKKHKTPWKMVRSIIGTNKSEPVKKKSLPAKKPSLIEIAQEEGEPFLGIWMGPPEKLSPEPIKNPRSKSFEVPNAKQMEMLSQRKIARGASYSPKASVSGKISTDSSSKWSKVRNAFLTREEIQFEETQPNNNSSTTISSPSSPVVRNSASFFAEEGIEENTKLVKGTEESLHGSRSSGDWHHLQGEIQQSYQQLQRQLSQEFQQKMQSWEKDRQSSKDSPGSPCLSRNVPLQSSAQDLVAKSNFPPDFKKKYEQWQKIKEEPSTSAHQTDQATGSGSGGVASTTSGSGAKLPEKSMATTSPSSEKKIRARPLQQQTIQEQDLKPEFRLKVAEWEVRKAMAGTSKKNVDEIRQLMPEDFNKKLQEWELKKQVPAPPPPPTSTGSANVKPNTTVGSASPIISKTNIIHNNDLRRDSKGSSQLRETRAKSHESGIAWLEKELQKLQREKQRLEREKSKYVEREHRLEKIRNAMGMQEITVKTSKGEEFKFGGISEKFTQKLFEWEERRNIAPESSTIALLNDLHGEPGNSKLDEKKRCRSEGSLLDPSESPPLKNIGGSDGNLSQCSIQSSKTRKSNEIGIEDSDQTPQSAASMTERLEKEKKLHQKQLISRHNSIRTQANIQLLDEKINLIGSLKAHREHCQHLESTLQNLEIQASNLPQVPSEMINTIQELKKDVLYTFQFPTTSTAPTDENNSEVEFHSESDLSCCDGGQDDHPGGDNVEVEEKISNISSSHSMSRYGSESPLRSLLQLDFDELKEHNEQAIAIDDSIIEEFEEPTSKIELSQQTSSNSETGQNIRTSRSGKQRRPSSDNISTPTSVRSRSSSLLSSHSSDLIPEEENDFDEISSQHQPSPKSPRKFENTRNSNSRNSPSPNFESQEIVASVETVPGAAPMTSEIDKLCKLVHELKEEDLNNYRRKIAEQKASAATKIKEERFSSSPETEVVPPLPPSATTPVVLPTDSHVVELQNVLVPTTTKLINAIPQIESLNVAKSRRSPVFLELATASLDLVLPATEIKCKIQPSIPSITCKNEDLSTSSNTESRNSMDLSLEQRPSSTESLLSPRANQLKKAREDFFLGSTPSTSNEFTTSEFKSSSTGTSSKVFKKSNSASKSHDNSHFRFSLAEHSTILEDETKDDSGSSWSCPPSPKNSPKISRERKTGARPKMHEK